MTFPCKLGAAGVLGLLLFPLTSLPSATSAAAADDLAWPPITAQARPWAWWWWHGSAVDETNLQHELERFHAAGLGGVQITSIYGTKGAEAREIPYLTPQWLAMMGFTVDHARTLGMGVDMSLGSGWCFGGPTVKDQDANASVVVKKVEVAAGQKITANFPRASTQALVAYPAHGCPLEITGHISSDGDVDWTAPMDAGSWTVYAISQKPSGQKVKRPALGGEGWMLNPAYPQAVRDWLTWFDQALAPYHGSKPEAVFQDSYEYRTDWAPDFFAQFEKRRGYRLQTELPALFADESRSADRTTSNAVHIARVKYDYRRTAPSTRPMARPPTGSIFTAMPICPKPRCSTTTAASSSPNSPRPPPTPRAAPSPAPKPAPGSRNISLKRSPTSNTLPTTCFWPGSTTSTITAPAIRPTTPPGRAGCFTPPPK
jgi:hypothetical protein